MALAVGAFPLFFYNLGPVLPSCFTFFHYHLTGLSSVLRFIFAVSLRAGPSLVILLLANPLMMLSALYDH